MGVPQGNCQPSGDPCLVSKPCLLLTWWQKMIILGKKYNNYKNKFGLIQYGTWHNEFVWEVVYGVYCLGLVHVKVVMSLYGLEPVVKFINKDIDNKCLISIIAILPQVNLHNNLISCNDFSFVVSLSFFFWKFIIHSWVHKCLCNLQLLSVENIHIPMDYLSILFIKMFFSVEFNSILVGALVHLLSMLHVEMQLIAVGWSTSQYPDTSSFPSFGGLVISCN